MAQMQSQMQALAQAKANAMNVANMARAVGGGNMTVSFGNPKHMLLFQKMYEQHGTPVWAGRLVAAIIGLLILFCVFYSYESQIYAYELAAADLGVFRRDSSIELGRR